MDTNLTKIKTDVYDKCALEITKFKLESESKEYSACRFELNGLNIVCRNAKITPKKVGQFVTFWKRDSEGITEPMHETDRVDYYVIIVKKDENLGQFIFPKSILVDNGIISTNKKEGKRGFRVYPLWDTTNNKQAEKTQKWQLNHFVEFNSNTDLKRLENLYLKI